MEKVQKNNLIAVDIFCANHNIEISFINSLHQIGMIEITKVEKTEFIEVDQLQELERLIRFYYEMDINLEGIETVTHLLQRINFLQSEVIILKNRLRLYESGE